MKVSFTGSQLQSLPMLKAANGTRYVELSFNVRDKAGNRSQVTLDLVIDRNASRNPLGWQKNLPKRKISKLLRNLLKRHRILKDQLPPRHNNNGARVV